MQKTLVIFVVFLLCPASSVFFLLLTGKIKADSDLLLNSESFIKIQSLDF